MSTRDTPINLSTRNAIYLCVLIKYLQSSSDYQRTQYIIQILIYLQFIIYIEWKFESPPLVNDCSYIKLILLDWFQILRTEKINKLENKIETKVMKQNSNFYWVS